MHITIDAQIKLDVNDERYQQALKEFGFTNEQLLERLQEEAVKSVTDYIADWDNVALMAVNVDITREESQC